MKKILALFLTLLIAFTLVGCSKKNSIIGEWSGQDPTTGEHGTFIINEKNMTLIIDDYDFKVTAPLEIKSDKFVLSYEGQSAEIPYALNQDGSMTIEFDGMEMILFKAK